MNLERLGSCECGVLLRLPCTPEHRPLRCGRSARPRASEAWQLWWPGRGAHRQARLCSRIQLVDREEHPCHNRPMPALPRSARRRAAAQACGPSEADRHPCGAARPRQDLPVQQADVLPELVRQAGWQGTGHERVYKRRAREGRRAGAGQRSISFSLDAVHGACCSAAVCTAGMASRQPCPGISHAPGRALQAGPPHQALQRGAVPAAHQGLLCAGLLPSAQDGKRVGTAAALCQAAVAGCCACT